MSEYEMELFEALAHVEKFEKYFKKENIKLKPKEKVWLNKFIRYLYDEGWTINKLARTNSNPPSKG